MWWVCFWLALIAFTIPGLGRVVDQLKRIADVLERLEVRTRK